MKQPFREDRQPSNPNPLDYRVEDFEWEALAALISDAEGEHVDPTAPDIALLAEVLARLFAWLTAEARVPAKDLDRLIGRRALAMVWVIRPDLIAGTPSLARLARRIGETRAGLSWHASAFSREFQVRNRAQASGWNKRPQPPQATLPPSTDEEGEPGA